MDDLDLTECSTASTEPDSVENGNVSDSNTEKNFIPVHVFKQITNPSTQKSKLFLFFHSYTAFLY